MGIEHSFLALIQQYGVPIVALLVFVGELGVPTVLPVEVALLVVGSTSIHSFPELLFGLLLVVVADLLGTTTLYMVSRTGGVRLLQRLAPRLVAAKDDGVMTRWRRRLGDRDAFVVFVARVLPLIRMWATVSAGLLRFRIRDFLLGAAPAAALWAGTPLTLGYLFRDHVNSFAAQYTRSSRLLTLAIPLVAIVAVAVWWVWRGGSVRSRVRRGRSLLGLGAAVAFLVFLVRTALVNQWSIDHGRAALSYPLLLVGLGVLVCLAAALLAVAFADLRTARRNDPRVPMSRLMMSEVATTLLWATLVGVGGGIMTIIELRYPGI